MQSQRDDPVLCALLVTVQKFPREWDQAHVYHQKSPHNQVPPGSVAEWKLVEVEHMSNIEEGGPQQITQESKKGVGEEEDRLRPADRLAKRRCVHGKADDWDQNLAQPHAPTHGQGWILQ